MVSHSDVINNYFNAWDREHYNKGSSVYFKGDTLYSYGTHFILAQKVENGYIQNGDSYSNSTAKHQSITRNTAPDNSPIIPYSVLNQILKSEYNDDKIEIAKISIIDVTSDTYVKYTAYDKDGKPYEAERHVLGASLIKYGNKYYLSSVDSGSKNWGAFFLVQLPKFKEMAPSVENAFRLLAGNLTDSEYKDYTEGKIKRQGEYFLIPCNDTIIKKKSIKNKVDLSKGKGNTHIARDYVIFDKYVTLIRGTLRHTEHKMISMGQIWHRVIKNTAKKSFTATGNVD